MARWHQLSCTQPSFAVSAGIPRCRTCDTSPELESIQPQLSPLPPIPPDEPYAQKNLWWPKTVKFTKPAREEDEFEKRSLDIETTPGLSNLRSEQDASLEDKSQNVDSRVPSIYGPTLGQEKFRLIYLESSESEDDPVHLSLETYSHDNCPEYETASYTWANGKNSSELCKPIYIGHNWDILFQTENCWEMLKFMRPRRGSRMIWVDAICINQGNVSERGAQVEKMGKIYSECLRVVVYLGKENITAMSPQNHPRRKMLGDDSAQPSFPGTENTLSDVLKSRYFSRVWVIQELILARQVSMRIGDVEFWADPTTWRDRSGSHSPWLCTAPSWLQYTAQGGLSETKCVDSLIRLTSNSKASDPRDKIFGLLGLLPGNELSADYTLSCQHVFIGIFAFCLQRLNNPSLLHHASGLSGPPGYPSWAPDWASDRSWTSLFIPPEPLTEATIMQYCREGNCDPKKLDIPNSFSLPAWTKTPWHKDVEVSSASGALTIFLTHLLTIPTKPTPVSNGGALRLFEVHGSNIKLCLCSLHNLEERVCPQKDKIFMLSTGSEVHYFILRPNQDSETFQFIASCYYVLFVSPLLDIQKEISWSVYDELQQNFNWVDGRHMGVSERWIQQLIFPGFKDQDRDQIFPAYLGLYNESIRTGESFEDLWPRCVEPRFDPRINNNFIEYTLAPEDWKIWCDNYFDDDDSDLDPDDGVSVPEDPFYEDWEYCTNQETWSRNMPPNDNDTPSQVYVRHPIQSIKDIMRNDRKVDGGYIQLARSLEYLHEVTGEDELSLLRKGLQEEDKFVWCGTRTFGPLLRKEFDVTIRTSKVTII